MVDLREKGWLIPLLSGIIVLIVAFIPFSIYYNSESKNGSLIWLFGAYASISKGELQEIKTFSDSEFVAVGSLYFIIVLIIGIFLVLSALMTMKGKDIPHKGKIWLLSGIFLLLLPTLYRMSFIVVGEMIDTEILEIFMYHFDSLMIAPIAGILAIVPGAKEIAR